MEKKLELVEPHKQKETFSVHLKRSLSKHINDQPNDLKEDGFPNLFFEDCNQPVTNSVSGDFKKYFSMPIYDGYEDEYLDIVPKKPAKYFANYGTVCGKNIIPIHGQKS